MVVEESEEIQKTITFICGNSLITAWRKKYGDSEGSFITEVDYVILDSVWYDSVGTSSCIANNDDADCLKDNLGDLIIAGEVGDFIKTCIDEYQEGTLSRRKKRSANRHQDSKKNQKITRWSLAEYFRFYTNYKKYSAVYQSSLMEGIDQGKYGRELGRNTYIKERGLGAYNYQRLSAFIQTQTLKKCGPKDIGYVEDWKSRFVLLTKEKSDLYEAIVKTSLKATRSQQLTYQCTMTISDDQFAGLAVGEERSDKPVNRAI